MCIRDRCHTHGATAKVSGRLLLAVDLPYAGGRLARGIRPPLALRRQPALVPRRNCPYGPYAWLATSLVAADPSRGLGSYLLYSWLR